MERIWTRCRLYELRLVGLYILCVPINKKTAETKTLKSRQQIVMLDPVISFVRVQGYKELWTNISTWKVNLVKHLMQITVVVYFS